MNSSPDHNSSNNTNTRDLDSLLKKLQKTTYYSAKRQISYDKQRFEHSSLISATSTNRDDSNDDDNVIEIKLESLIELSDEDEAILAQADSSRLVDSYLGTIKGDDEEMINNLAEQLSSSLNIPYVFMSIEEYNKMRETELMCDSVKQENVDYILYDDIEVQQQEGQPASTSNTIPNEINENYVTVQGDTLIKLLFGECCDTYKDAVDRSSVLEENFRKKLSEKLPTRPVSYYISRHRYRKLQLNEKFKRLKLTNNDLSNMLFSIKPGNSTKQSLVTLDDDSTRTTTTTINSELDLIIIDFAIYKCYLYICALSGACRVYNLNTNKLLNSVNIKNGVKFVQPVYNESRLSLNIIIGSGLNQTNLYIYDAVLRNKRNTIDLKSEIRCSIFRYKNLYCGLNSGEVVAIGRNLSSIQNIIKVTDKKISCLGFAMIDDRKLLLIGAYDGKIHIVRTKFYYDQRANTRSDVLYGHEMAPLAIKCRNEYIFSCSSDRHILTHCLKTYNLISRVLLEDTVTGLAIQQNVLISSGFDGLIKCFEINNGKLKLIQQYYGHDTTARLMCLKTEGNMIFYGDDKGNVESLELNTEKIYECKFLNCSKPFATTHYLLKHIFMYHFNYLHQQKNDAMVKCEWLKCNKWFKTSQLKSHIVEHFEYI